MHMKKSVLSFKKAALVFSLLCPALFPAFSKTSFSVYDINSSNQLLYSAKLDFPGTASSSSLFECRLGKTSAENSPSLLTCVPEKMELLYGNVVQLRNSFGTARYSMDTGKLTWILRNDSFPAGQAECPRQIESPDGKWICVEDNAGGLSLIQSSSGVQVKISAVCPPSDSVLVKWSDDSKYFLYEESGTVYFASSEAAIKELLPPCSMRKIGEGSLESVQWIKENIYYANADILYRIEGRGLYTRGLYYAVTGYGTPVARLASPFDSLHDKFFISGDEKYILCVSGKKIASLYSLPDEFGFASVREMESLLGLSGSLLDINVFWSSRDIPYLWIENLSYSKGKKSASVYTMNKGLSLVETYQEPGEIRLSPDKKTAAFIHGKNLELRNVDGWTLVSKSEGEKMLSFRWLDSDSVIAGGCSTLFKWSRASSSKKWEKSVLYLSSVKCASWDSGKIRAWTELDSTCYEYNEKNNSWSASGKKNAPASSEYVANGKFRAYTAECPNAVFSDAVFVRSLAAPAYTYALIPETNVEKKSKGKVSLVFDAVEGNEGLAQVLSVLEKFGFKATFFINGEFIRRYPIETCQIVASGCRCASGFFTSTDLICDEFDIDADFIRRGLARNEDEFLAASGKELELLWHAPYYHADEMMVRAGTSAGYRYVDSWNEVNDRISFEDALSDAGTDYLSADEIIKRMVESLHDGMVISVDIGNIKGTRGDYLYEKLHALISAVLNSGYDIVPLSEIK